MSYLSSNQSYSLSHTDTGTCNLMDHSKVIKNINKRNKIIILTG